MVWVVERLQDRVTEGVGVAVVVSVRLRVPVGVREVVGDCETVRLAVGVGDL